MADDNFLMQFDIDLTVLNAAPTQQVIDRITAKLGKLGSASKELAASRQVEAYFKSLSDGGKLVGDDLTRVADALTRFSNIKIAAKERVDELKDLGKALNEIQKSLGRTSTGLDTLAKARSFQGLDGIAKNIAANSAKVREFTKLLRDSYKAGADLPVNQFPATFLPSKSGAIVPGAGQARVRQEVAAAEASATTAAEKRIAVYQTLQRLMAEQAAAVGRINSSLEVQASIRLDGQFKQATAAVKMMDAEVKVLIDRATRIKGLTAEKLAFTPIDGITQLRRVPQDQETNSVFKGIASRMRQQQSEMRQSLEETSRSAKGVEGSLRDIAAINLSHGATDLAAQMKADAAAVKTFREQIDAAAKAGATLDLSRMALPTSVRPGATDALRAGLQSVSAKTPAGVASQQQEILNRYLQEEQKYLDGIVATEREIGTATKGTTDAVKAETDARKLELSQMLYAKNAAAEQYAAMATQIRQTRVLRELQNKQAGNFYPLIIATGIYTGLAHAIEGVDKAAIGNAISQQQAFSSVKRTADTTGDAKVQIEGMRLALQKLSTETPLTFEELSKVATAGNELGLSAEQVPAFTRVVAEYSKVTGTTLEDTTKAFGGLAVVLDIPTAKMENFGSAVSLAGRKSAASEAEVVKMTARIGSTAHQAGFAIPEIVGLGAAMASIKEPPERTQGALEKFFTNTGKAALEGGEKWKAYTKIIGMGADTGDAKKLFDSDPYAFFRRFLKGLGDIREAAKKTGFGVSEAMGQALTSVGLGANVRVKEVFTRASGTGAQKELDKDVANANKGYAEGNDLSKQYAKQVANLQDQFKELQNAVNNFFAAIGKAPVSGLTTIVGSVKDLVSGMAHLAEMHPVFTQLVVAIVAVATAMALLKAASFAAAIATYGLEAAQSRIGSTSLLGSLGKLSNLLLGTSFGAAAASGNLSRMGIASETATAGFTLSTKSAQQLAMAMEDLQIVGNGEGLALMGRQGIVAGSGLAVASKEAQYLAEQLVAADIGITTTSGALAVMKAAGIVGADGMIIASAGAKALGWGLNFAADRALFLARSFFPLAVLTYLTFLLTDFRGTLLATGGVMGSMVDAFSGVNQVIAAIGTSIIRVIAGIVGGLAIANSLNPAEVFTHSLANARDRLNALADSFSGLGDAANKANKGGLAAFNDWAKKQKGMDLGLNTDEMKKADAEYKKMLAAQKNGGAGAESYKDKEKRLKDEIAALKAQMPDATAAQDKHTAATKKAADAAALAAKNFRTYADYAQELGGVLQRSFDIQFGPQQSHDAIASTFNEMRKQSTDATKSIRDARTQIQGINADMEKLRADNVQKSYFLGIANAFGDRVGAASIQADIAKNNADMRDKQNSKSDAYKQIGDAYATLDTATTGNTETAIKNRDTLSGLVGKYQDYITKLAASGISQKELNQKVKEARAEFIRQGEAMGFSKQQLAPYAKAMEGFGEIVRKIPRNVTVTAKANTSAASLALDEFFKKKAVDAAAEAAQKMNQSLNTIGSGMNSALQKQIDALNKQLDKLHDKEKKRHAIVMPGIRFGRNSGAYNAAISSDMGQISGLNAELKQAINNGRPERVLDEIIRRMKLASNALADHQRLSGAFYTGGYTGPGGKYEPAGIVHKGEYVVPKYMVNQQTGLPYADALGRLMSGTRPQSGYAAGGYVNPEMMVVEPGPKFMRKLQEIVQTEVSAVIEPRAIAGANTDYLTGQRRRGSSK